MSASKVEAGDRSRFDAMVLATAALLSLAAGLYIFATTWAMVVRGWSAIPYWDQWDDLIFTVKQVFSPWLYSQHNEHRLILPRLLFAIDSFAFGETNKFDLFCNMALPSMLAGLLGHAALRDLKCSLTDRLWVAGIILAMLFSAMQYENFLWGFQLQFFAVELAGAASVACLALGGRSWTSLTASIAFSSIAVYTLASGIVVPFAAVPVALCAQRSRAQIAVLAAAATALLVSYLYGYHSPAGSDPLAVLLRKGLVVYALSELGNPFGPLLRRFQVPYFPSLDRGFGALGLGVFAVAGLAYLRRGRAAGGPDLVFLALAGLSVGTAFLTALGRLNLGYSQALASRYATPMLLFWLSLTMLGILEVQYRCRRARPLAMGLSLPFLLILAYAQSAFVKTGLAAVMPRREAITALLANVDDPDALLRVYPRPDLVVQQGAKLRAQHLAMFAEKWSTWLGAPLADHIRLGDPTQCRGGIDQVTALATPKRAQWRVRGWAWDNAASAVPARVVLTDNSGRVVGYALAGYSPPPGHPRHSGWRGHFAADKDMPVTAYALIDRQQTACPLARWPVSP